MPASLSGASPVPKRTELPPGWELPDDDERIDIAEEAFRCCHTVHVYGSRLESLFLA
jgi:hypothetical protein